MFIHIWVRLTKSAPVGVETEVKVTSLNLIFFYHPVKYTPGGIWNSKYPHPNPSSNCAVLLGS